jgi:hypothetical protein
MSLEKMMKTECSELPEDYEYQDTSIQIDGCACAIIGCEDGRIIYDYDLLIIHFHEHENMKSLDDYDGEHDTAIEWIDYNVIRGLDYCGPGIKPDIRDDGVSIIDYDEDDED